MHRFRYQGQNQSLSRNRKAKPPNVCLYSSRLRVIRAFCPDQPDRPFLMASLSQRLLQMQTHVAIQVEDLSHLTLEELHTEAISFGQKHRGQSFQETWKDQEWVSWMVSHYGHSNKTSHRRFLRYVELKLDHHEAQQLPIPVVPQDSLPMTSSGAKGSAKSAGPSPGMIAAKAKIRPQHPGLVHLPDMEDAGWALEPGTYTQGTMNQDPNMEAMQQRMLNLENALTRVIQHIEVNTVPAQLSRQSPVEEESDVESLHLG